MNLLNLFDFLLEIIINISINIEVPKIRFLKLLKLVANGLSILYYHFLCMASHNQPYKEIYSK